jgi:hypothetical protein
MDRPLGRRQVIQTGGAFLSALALDGCAGSRPHAPTLPPIRASADRVIKITVCTRPFRADGPRLDVERIGDKIVVHNYGHGGSGWSLSWGSSTIAVRNAMATGAKDIAVIGCGALGLTSAILLQRAGVAVTIYAKDRPPDVRSSLASGVWTPDSRICLESGATPAFKQAWEEMCRISFRTYQDFLGLPGAPVEWVDFYRIHDLAAQARPPENSIKFAELQRELVSDLAPPLVTLGPAANPFPGYRVQRHPSMVFNLTEYQRLLISDFLANGGRIRAREFRSPAEFSTLSEKALINATGYGAKALFGDASVIPVRGQLARLIPQPEVRYSLAYRDVSYVPRRDGSVVQALGADESFGYGDESTMPDPAEANSAIATIASLFPNAEA